MKFFPLLFLVIAPAICQGAVKNKAKKPATPKATYEQAQQQFNNYDFEQARETISKYINSRTAAQEAADSHAGYDAAVILKDRIDLGQSMIDRVEQVEVIDSINIPLNQFLNGYKLSPSSGRLISSQVVSEILSPQWLQANKLTLTSAPAYVTQDGQMVIFTARSQGQTALFQTTLLANKQWETPIKLMDYAGAFGQTTGSRVETPYLMADGITLYLAADGESSLGGLDIFISRNDGDKFLQPSNVGMPYNSTANDYMMAIDEETNLGYWASDRYAPEGYVTVYTFLPSENRVNYPVDKPDLINAAKLTSIRDTQKPERDYQALIAEKRAKITAPKEENADFSFSLPGERVYVTLSDFHNSEARLLMKKYLAADKAYEQKKIFLSGLRAKYENGDRELKGKILALENELPEDYKALTTLRNEVIKAEM